MMKTALPTLYALSSTKKVKQWSITVDGDDTMGVIVVSHGYLDGKIQTNSKEITKGKNLGKKNATTPYTQAVADAQSMWNKKKDSQYIETVPDKDFVPDIGLPMLAQNFTKRKHNIKYPAMVQPKLNGVRCLAKKISETEIRYLSRKGKSFGIDNNTLQHLTPALLEVMDINDEMDGEIFHPEWTFQKILRNVKKLRPSSKDLQYWLYDMADGDFTSAANTPVFGARNCQLRLNLNILSPDNCNLIYVETLYVDSEDDVYKYHNDYIAKGFEGIIIRNTEGLYKYDHRSADLQKYKEFIDEEFEIVGGTEGTGLDKGCVIFRVKNKDNHEFNVKPKGTRESRQEILQNIEKYIGKELTVRYQELSEDGVPIFPVGIAVRDYE